MQMKIGKDKQFRPNCFYVPPPHNGNDKEAKNFIGKFSIHFLYSLIFTHSNNEFFFRN